MHNLPNNCRRSAFNIFPENWNTTRAPITRKGKNLLWRIEYRFYDDRYKRQFPKGKLKSIKTGVNRINTVEGRQQVVRTLLKLEEELLAKGYNPILEAIAKINTSTKSEAPKSVGISKKSTLQQALEIAVESKAMHGNTRDDIRNKIPHIVQAAGQLYYDKNDEAVYILGDAGRDDPRIRLSGVILDEMPVCQFTKLHMRSILDQIGINKEKSKKNSWTNNNFNSYKKDIGILFGEIEELGATMVNPTAGIRKRKVVKNEPRETLTEEEYNLIAKYLLENYYRFGRFFIMYSSSHCRETEFMLIQRQDVNIPDQTYIVTQFKGGEYVRVTKDIPDDALQYWIEAMQDYPPTDTGSDEERANDYLFAQGLRPGPVPIDAIQITRRWRNHVKNSLCKEIKELNITADIYSVKHKATTDTVDAEAERIANESIEKAQQTAAEKNSHTTTKMVRTVYDVKSGDRKRHLKKRVKIALRKIEQH